MALLSDDEVFGSGQPSGLMSDDEVFVTKPKPSSLARRAADIPLGLIKGVVDLPSAAVGLADIPTNGLAGKAVGAVTDSLGQAADAVGLPAGARPSNWSKELGDLYSPEVKKAQQAVHQGFEQGEQTAADNGDGTIGKFIGGAKSGIAAMASNPSSIIPLIAENYGGMKAIAKGTAHALAPMAAKYGEAVKAGTMTQEAADAALATAAGRTAAVGEGLLDAGQNTAQVEKENPDATFVDRALQGVSGAITGGISRGVSKIPGLGDVEANMALKDIGSTARTGLSGGRLAAAGKGVLSEGVLEELPQSMQGQVWQNLGTNKPWDSGLAEQGVSGLVAGAGMGGAMGLAHAQPKTKLPDAGPLSAAVNAGVDSGATSLDAPLALGYQAGPPLVNFPDGTTMTQAEYQQHKAQQEQSRLDGMIQPIPATPEQVKALGYQPGTPLVVFPDGTAMTRAEYVQQEAAKEQSRLDGMVQPADAPASPAATPQPGSLAAAAQKPAGSFANMDELARLIGQEKQDVEGRRQNIADTQELRRNVETSDADNRVADAMAKESAQRRRDVLNGVLADESTVDHAKRFAAELKRQGFRDAEPTESELATVQRFNDIKNAQPADPEAEPALPNELDAAGAGIKERAPKAAPQSGGRDKAAEIKQLVAEGWKVSGKTLISPTGKKRNINIIERGHALNAQKEISQKASQSLSVPAIRQAEQAPAAEQTSVVATEPEAKAPEVANAPAFEQVAQEAPQADAPKAGATAAQATSQGQGIDLSNRTHAQLNYLSKNGKNGHKEAAIAELQRRGKIDAQKASAVSESVPALKAEDSADRPNGDGYEQRNASRVSRINKANTQEEFDAITAEEKDAWDSVNQKIDLTNNMHVADTIGYRVFDVPGDGKFKVLNLKEALQRFRERIDGNPGFSKPRTPSPQTKADWQKTGRGGTEATIKEFIDDGELLTAVEYAKQIGKPLVFGQYQDGSSVTVYTDSKPFEHDGYDDFKMVSARAAGASEKVAWAVIDLGSGMTVSSKHPTRMKAIAETHKALAKMNAEQLATNVKSAKANSGFVGTQEELEQRWVEWAAKQEELHQAKNEQEQSQTKPQGVQTGLFTADGRATRGAATSDKPASKASSRISETQERTARAVNPGSSEPVQSVNEAGGDSYAATIPPKVQAEALKAAQKEQDRLNDYDLQEEIRSLSENGGVDLYPLTKNPEYWDAENEEFTEAGFKEVDRLTEQQAREILNLPTFDSLDDLDNAHQFAQVAAMEKILDGIGIGYDRNYSFSTSRYIMVRRGNGIADLKLRFADHLNTAKGQPHPDVNVAPGGNDFSDAVKEVLRIAAVNAEKASNNETDHSPNAADSVIAQAEAIAPDTTVQVEPITVTDSVKSTGQENKIADFGEKLEGAKKDLLKSYQKAMSDALPTDGKALYSFAGQSAETADTHALSTAQQRLASGDDAESVRKETGWFKGADGKWRFEIDDSGATKGKKWEELMSGESKYARQYGYRLAAVLDHPALFAAYPYLEDYRVYNKPSLGFDTRGSFNAEDQKFYLNGSLYGADLFSTLLHEIQHGIQDIEGFARGSNPDKFARERDEADAMIGAHNRNMSRIVKEMDVAKEQGNSSAVTRLKAEYDRSMALRDELVQKAQQDPYETYQRVAGEVESRNTQARQNLTAEERKKHSPESTQDVSNNDVIVVFNGTEMASALPPANASNAVGNVITQPEATQRILSLLGNKLGQVLLDSGIITFTNKGNAYQGATYTNGKIALNLDNLTANNFDGVIQHEGLHSTLREYIGEETYSKLMGQLDSLIKMGKGSQWVKDANAAIPKETAPENVTEEIAAYAVEQHVNGGKLPNVLKRWAQDFLSTLRTAIIKSLPNGKLKSWAIANITAQDLSNLAIAGLKAKAQGQLQAQGREAMAYSSPVKIDDLHSEFWSSIKAGKNDFTKDEIYGAYANGRRGTSRAGYLDTISGKALSSPEAARVAAEWDENISGFKGYVTTATWATDAEGLETFYVSVVPKILWGKTDASSAASLNNSAIMQYAFSEMTDGTFDLHVNDVAKGSEVERLLKLKGRLQPAKENPLYQRAVLDSQYTETRGLMQEAIRRLALAAGIVPTVTQSQRDTGARAGSKERRVYPGKQVESKFSKDGQGDSSIRYSRASAAIADYLKPKAQIIEEKQSGPFAIPRESKIDDIIYAMQDKQVDLKRVVDNIKKAGGTLNDGIDPYLQEELFHGRSTKGVDDFLDFELKPLINEMRLRNIGMADFEEYLWNRHAEERNQQIAKINAEMPDGGSGIKTADAKAYLDNLPAGKKEAYSTLAKRVDAINKKSQDILVVSGLEKQATIDAWNSAYSAYVPLHRDDVDTGNVGTGKGYSIRGSSSKRATGSGKPVVDVLANIAMQRERNVVRAEKNRMSNALLGLAEANPHKDIWTVDDAPTERAVVTRGGNDEVVTRIIPGFAQRDNVIHTRIDGEDHYVIMNEREPRAIRMAQAIKNLDADQLGRVLSATAKATRYMAAINTQYNPVFGVVNLTRDSQTAMLNLSTTELKGQQKKVIGYTLSALRGIYADVRAHRKGEKPTSEWAGWYESFKEAGGQTGFRDQYENSAQRGEAIQKELNALDRNFAFKKAGAVFDWLSDYNEMMENAVRVAAYRASVEHGVSNERSASLAKNLTVNFNRKGQVATQMGALYAFFNASVQGTARLAETMTGPAGKKIFYGGLLLGAMQAMLLASAGMGDDEPPEFVRERSLILPIGDGKYISIPMPLGFHIIPNLARIPTEFVMAGFKNPANRIADLFGLFADTFNPIGNAGLSLQTIAPTVVDPLAALSENRDWTGKPIAKADRDSMNPTPGYLRTKDTATTWSKGISYSLNLLTGGTDYKKGLFSPTPDQIDYLIGQATGGVGREAAKIEQTISSMSSGEDLPIYKIPLVGRFVGDTQGKSAETGKFYSAIQRINEHENEIKGMAKNHRGAEISEYIAENPEAKFVAAANHAEREIQRLNRVKHEAVKKGNTERVKQMESAITQRMNQFNGVVERLSK